MIFQFSILGSILSVLLFLPSALLLAAPPKDILEVKEAPVFTILEKIGQASTLLVLIFIGKNTVTSQDTIAFVLALSMLALYYACWIRYVIKGKNYVDLYAPLYFVPIPLAVFPVLYFLFLAIWGNSMLLALATIVFAVGHLAISWKIYKATLEKKS